MIDWNCSFVKPERAFPKSNAMGSKLKFLCRKADWTRAGDVIRYIFLLAIGRVAIGSGVFLLSVW